MDLREIVWRLFKQALKGLKRKRKKNTNIETHFIKLKLDTKAKKIKSVNGERGERERERMESWEERRGRESRKWVKKIAQSTIFKVKAQLPHPVLFNKMLGTAIKSFSFFDL